jgi:predicted N-acetyltransferase YhbS
MVESSRVQKDIPSSTQIEIKLLGSEDEKNLLNFFRHNLVTWEKFKLYWRWRNKNKNASGGEMAVIAKADGDIVGCVGIMSADVTLNGDRIKTSWQQDSLVSPAMRGKGLGKQLVNEGGKGWDMAMAKGTSKAMYGLRKSLGFLDVPNSDYLLRICKPRAMVRTLKERLVEYILWLWKNLIHIPGEDPAIDIKPIDAFDQSFDILADELSKENVVRLHKGQGYLNWRYFQCPGKFYKVFRAGVEKACGVLQLYPLRENGYFDQALCLQAVPRGLHTVYKMRISIQQNSVRHHGIFGMGMGMWSCIRKTVKS